MNVFYAGLFSRKQRFWFELINDGCSFILNQYIMPIMDESVLILEKGSLLEIMERVRIKCDNSITRKLDY